MLTFLCFLNQTPASVPVNQSNAKASASVAKPDVAHKVMFFKS